MNRTTRTNRQNTDAEVSGTISIAPELRWLAIGLFLTVIALLGGSSRPDPIQNALLRPVIALFFIPALYHLRLADLAPVKWLMTLLGLMVAWMALQLVPLPPELWRSLPDRALIAELDELAGLDGTWRPLSMTPFRGLNSLLGVTVPIAALLLAILMKMTTRTTLLAIAAIGLIDAMFGLLQVAGKSESQFYLFAITHRGAPAGVFANENHSAVFSAVALLSIARFSIDEINPRNPFWLRPALAAAFTFILLDALVTGSRAGLIATFAALVAAVAMAWLKKRKSTAGVGVSRQVGNLKARGRLIIPAFAAVVALVIAGFVWLERTPALQNILLIDPSDDLRWSLWPLLTDMANMHWIFGTGFGSFDAVYRIYEPTELLLPAYVNHAHNDWAQLVIEGGLPAVVISLVGLGWLGRTWWVVLRKSDRKAVNIIFWFAWVSIVGAASIVDYPLRTPIFQCVVIWLLASLAFERARVASRTLAD